MLEESVQDIFWSFHIDTRDSSAPDVLSLQYSVFDAGRQEAQHKAHVLSVIFSG